MSETVRRHYELYPYPQYPLLASVRRCDTYASNLSAIWSRFNGELPHKAARRILIAGCGSFAPYPFGLANPATEITALDLSTRSLGRARLHCLLHGVRGVEFRAGDLCDPATLTGEYGLIDAYGVLHHLADPAAGLRALAARLAPGGIMRVMVYSSYTRREEESIRRALRLLKIQDVAGVRSLIARSAPESRLRRFSDASHEVAQRSGLADALLHPQVRTYRIEPFMDLVQQSSLEPLLFAHRQALQDVQQEVVRIKRMEQGRRSPGNFVLYLGRRTKGAAPDADEARLLLNPCLAGVVGPFSFGSVQCSPRLGRENPVLDGAARRFLSRFRRPVRAGDLSASERKLAGEFCEALFLLRLRPDAPLP
ncbi:SAM-dependent methyltransferase [Geomonas limicola]|uniref:SAM-dependent methyltransferase n=1 Tax=Geomonas limicola TaxID=2740186 RepID=A0A6V8N9W2_9BACT|nr:class I SAM-dependent methyltransferase [Geomonas limicola]GFO69385.1 SAM-dependent methyltransferase [Geomonas limicola]